MLWDIRLLKKHQYLNALRNEIIFQYEKNINALWQKKFFKKSINISMHWDIKLFFKKKNKSQCILNWDKRKVLSKLNSISQWIENWNYFLKERPKINALRQKVFKKASITQCIRNEIIFKQEKLISMPWDKNGSKMA